MSAYGSGKPEIYNAIVGTSEVTFDTGSRIKKIMIQARDDKATVRFAWQTGDTDTFLYWDFGGWDENNWAGASSLGYWTVKPGSVYYDDFINRSGSLYLRSDVDNTVVEIQIWRST